MQKLIIFLIRKKLGLKKCEHFRFANQKTDSTYYFTDTQIMKNEGGKVKPSNVKLNWIMSDECKNSIEKII